MAASPHVATIDQLRADLDGRVIAPGDSEYDTARTVFSGSIDRRPALIARPADASEVARVISAARETGLELAVRSGGHSGAGHSTIDDGLVLDLAWMRGIEIDPQSLTAWAQTGLTAAEYTKAAGEHGLATGFGDAGSVGIGGLTLGGGVGFLSRAHGLTIDDLLAAEIVTADGEILEADAENHLDLFWAIRGGGGNFGVATRFKFRLHELETVVGGMLMLPASAEVIRSFVAAAEAAPGELSTIANVMPAPPMPFVPAEHHGQLVVMGLLCYSGPPETADEVLAPFRSLATPIVDMVRAVPYPEMYEPTDPDFRPTTVGRSMFLENVEQADAETIVEYLRSSDAPMRVAQLRVLGGAVARVPADATAYAHRRSPIMVNVASFYVGEEDKAKRLEWVERFAANLRQQDTGAYVNFIADDGPEQVRAAYPEATLERLAAVKARYDRTNLFRSNHNVLPAAV